MLTMDTTELLAVEDGTELAASLTAAGKTRMPSIGSSLSPWYLITYPMQAVQSRLLCARYLTPIDTPKFPMYLSPDVRLTGHPYHHPPSASVESYTGPGNIPMIRPQPLLLAYTSPSSFNVFRLLGSAMRLVYDVEGVGGLLRGLVPSCLHRVSRDVVHWALLRYGLGFTVCCTRYYIVFWAWLLRPFRRIRMYRSSFRANRISAADDLPVEIKRIGDVTEVQDDSGSMDALMMSTRTRPCKNTDNVLTDCRDPGKPCENEARQRRLSVEVLDRAATVLIPPIVIKVVTELLCYPLLTLATRMIVIEGPICAERGSFVPAAPVMFPDSLWPPSRVYTFFLEVLNSKLVVDCTELAQLTLHEDGIAGFWQGVVPYLFTRSVDEFVASIIYLNNLRKNRSTYTGDTDCGAIGDSNSSDDSKNRASTNNTNSTAATTVTSRNLLHEISRSNRLNNRLLSSDRNGSNAEAIETVPRRRGSTLDRKLEQLEMYIMQAWLSAILNTAFAPLSHLSVVQRCQSRIQGLCGFQPWTRILGSVPWKPILVQFGICLVFLGLNSMALAHRHPEHSDTFECRDEEEPFS